MTTTDSRPFSSSTPPHRPPPRPGCVEKWKCSTIAGIHDLTSPTLLLDLSTSASARSKGQARRRREPALSPESQRAFRNEARRRRASLKRATTVAVDGHGSASTPARRQVDSEGIGDDDLLPDRLSQIKMRFCRLCPKVFADRIDESHLRSHILAHHSHHHESMLSPRPFCGNSLPASLSPPISTHWSVSSFCPLSKTVADEAFSVYPFFWHSEPDMEHPGVFVPRETGPEGGQSIKSIHLDRTLSEKSTLEIQVSWMHWLDKAPLSPPWCIIGLKNFLDVLTERSFVISFQISDLYQDATARSLTLSSIFPSFLKRLCEDRPEIMIPNSTRQYIRFLLTAPITKMER